MRTIMESVKETAAYLREHGFAEPPLVGIVLGTGLGALTHYIDIKSGVRYLDIPHFPEATVEFHQGNLLYGYMGNIPVIAMQGRFHFYEGYSMQQITFPIRVFKELGVEYLFLSNAAGGMNPLYKKGDIILIKDHINLLPDNPLRGLNDPGLGPRFTDMSCPYDTHLRSVILDQSKKLNLPIKEGVYVAVMGPNLETRSEYRWLHSMGADLVGMSTVPEVIVANQVGLKCAAMSVITDECDPDNLRPVNISEIIEVAGKADILLSELMNAVICSIG